MNTNTPPALSPFPVRTAVVGDPSFLSSGSADRLLVDSSSVFHSALYVHQSCQPPTAEPTTRMETRTTQRSPLHKRHFPPIIQALRLTGAWVSKTKSESSREILDSYLNPAVEAALVGGGAALTAASSAATDNDNDGGDDSGVSGTGAGWGGDGARRLLCAAHFTLAEYLAGLYASVKGRVESPEWQAAGRVAESRARELASCRKQVDSCVCPWGVVLFVVCCACDLWFCVRVL